MSRQHPKTIREFLIKWEGRFVRSQDLLEMIEDLASLIGPLESRIERLENPPTPSMSTMFKR